MHINNTKAKKAIYARVRREQFVYRVITSRLGVFRCSSFDRFSASNSRVHDVNRQASLAPGAKPYLSWPVGTTRPLDPVLVLQCESLLQTIRNIPQDYKSNRAVLLNALSIRRAFFAQNY